MSDHPQVALQRTLYDSTNPTRRYLHQCRREWVEGALERVFDRRRVQVSLDVGPGSGIYTRLLARNSELVLAFDLESFHLQKLRELSVTSEQRDRINLIQGNVDQLPIASGCVDVILCSEVIEHIPSSVPVIKRLCTALQDNGVLILTTPQPHSPLELLGRFVYRQPFLGFLRALYREPVEPTGHINLQSEDQLRRTFADAGLQIAEARKLALYLPVLAELGGRWGARVLQWASVRIEGTVLAGLLWTQCYVLVKVKKRS